MIAPQPCQSPVCRAKIIKVPHVATGTLHPIDWPDTRDQPGPACGHEGSLAVLFTARGIATYRILPEGGELAEGEHRATSHFVTCPDSAQFSSKAKCPKCKHPRHPDGPCVKLGPLGCRPLPGGGSMRGQFPCGCEHGLTPPGPPIEEVPSG